VVDRNRRDSSCRARWSAT